MTRTTTITRMEKTQRIERFKTESRASEEIRRLERLKETAYATLERLKLKLSIAKMTAAQRDEIILSLGSTRTFIAKLDEDIQAAGKSVR